MMNFKKLYKVFWFIGGFAIGFTLVSLSHASIPNPSLVTEIKSKPVIAPDLESDYSKLSQMEARYSESWQQQQKSKAATARVAGSDYSKNKKVKRD